MKACLRNKAAGFYLRLAALLTGLIALGYYLIWSRGTAGMNVTVLLGLGAAIGLNLLECFLHNEYLVVLTTAGYSVGFMQLLSDSAGSFADAYQGIVMFGDPTQVGAILTICGLMMVSILTTIVSGFMKTLRS